MAPLVAMVLIGGLLGAALWALLSRRRVRPPGALVASRFGGPSVNAAVGIVLAGYLGALLPGLADAPACAPPPDSTSLQMDIVRAPAATLPSRLERLGTAAPTGYGLLIARMLSAEVCFLRNENLYVVSGPPSSTGGRGYVLGNVFFSRPHPKDNSFLVLALYGHEARHRTHWAIGTALGGPAAYPVVYTLDDLFFPDARNHFERIADARDGRYTATRPARPRVGLAELFGVAALFGALEGFGALRRRRQQERLPPLP